jgi:hypothetical protein
MRYCNVGGLRAGVVPSRSPMGANGCDYFVYLVNVMRSASITHGVKSSQPRGVNSCEGCTWIMQYCCRISNTTPHLATCLATTCKRVLPPRVYDKGSFSCMVLSLAALAGPTVEVLHTVSRSIAQFLTMAQRIPSDRSSFQPPAEKEPCVAASVCPGDFLPFPISVVADK